MIQATEGTRHTMRLVRQDGEVVVHNITLDPLLVLMTSKPQEFIDILDNTVVISNRLAADLLNRCIHPTSERKRTGTTTHKGMAVRM